MGKRTWTAAHALYLKNLFFTGEANPSDTSPSHIKDVFNSHTIFRDKIPKERNFLLNYQKVAADYLSNDARSGARCGGKRKQLFVSLDYI